MAVVETIIVLAVTYIVPARSGRELTDYMPMASLEQCVAMAPSIIEGRFGPEKRRVISYRQSYGSADLTPVYVDYRRGRPTWECREISSQPSPE